MAKKAYVPTEKVLRSWVPNCQRKADSRRAYHNTYADRKSRWMGSGIVPPKKGGSGRAIKMAHASQKEKK